MGSIQIDIDNELTASPSLLVPVPRRPRTSIELDPTCLPAGRGHLELVPAELYKQYGHQFTILGWRATFAQCCLCPAEIKWARSCLHTTSLPTSHSASQRALELQRPRSFPVPPMGGLTRNTWTHSCSRSNQSWVLVDVYFHNPLFDSS